MQWFLSEHCGVFVHTTTISKRLATVGWSKKKADIIASARDEAPRSYHLNIMAEYSAEQLVYVDESGVVEKRDRQRRTGWSPKGAQPSPTAPLDLSSRLHLLPALTTEGLLDLRVYRGSTDRRGLIVWLRRNVIPKMNRFPGKHSVLVMDNTTWRHGPDLDALRDEFGIRIIYLPPYSPDFNPVEGYFGDVTVALRKHSRFKLDKWDSPEEFGDFLAETAREVGSNLEVIRGHFRQAKAKV